MTMFTNIILSVKLLTITEILLSGCSGKTKKKNIPVSIIKKIVVGLD